VPFTLIMKDGQKYSLREDGILADIAPTALELLHIPQPKAMSGKSLLK
jgi:2,3-bisphosphoglycerate-independent phosphoglycerate mutase